MSNYSLLGAQCRVPRPTTARPAPTPSELRDKKFLPAARGNAVDLEGYLPALLVSCYSSLTSCLLFCSSDNLQYGLQFSRKFVDAPEKTKHNSGDPKARKSYAVRARMNLHNNEAGRQVSCCEDVVV